MPEIDLKLSYFKTFLTLAKTKSFSKTAKELGVSQGTISNQIAMIEKFYNSKLFTRAIKGAELTKEGEILLEYVQRVLSEIKVSKEAISELQVYPMGTIKIAASTIPGEHVLPRLINNFRKQYPKINFEIEVSDSVKSLNALKNGKADLASVGTLQVDDEEIKTYEHIAIAKEKLVLIVPLHHELAKKSSIHIKEITKYPYINREKGSGTRIEVERMLNEVGLAFSGLNIALELGSTESILTAVSQGIGISIISEKAAKREKTAGLVKMLELTGSNKTRELFLVRKPKEQHPKIIELFWNYAKKDKY